MPEPAREDVAASESKATGEDGNCSSAASSSSSSSEDEAVDDSENELDLQVDRDGPDTPDDMPCLAADQGVWVSKWKKAHRAEAQHVPVAGCGFVLGLGAEWQEDLAGVSRKQLCRRLGCFKWD